MNGTLASTAMFFPPGRWMTMSGRPAPASVVIARLGVEVDPLDETGGLDDAAQLGLAPDAARAVGAQRGGERLGGGAQALLGLAAPGCSCCDSSPCWRLRWVSSSVTLGCISDRVCLHRGEGLEHLALGLLAVFAAFCSVRCCSTTSRYCDCAAPICSRRPIDRRVDGGELGTQLGLHGVLGRRGSRPARPIPPRAPRPAAPDGASRRRRGPRRSRRTARQPHGLLQRAAAAGTPSRGRRARCRRRGR